MKRRNALHTIAIGITGVATQTHCSLSTSIKSTIDHEDKELISLISKTILPPKSESFETPELRIEFIINQIEGTLTEKESEKYKSGYTDLKKQITSSYPNGFDSLNSNTKNNIIINAIDSDNDIGFFMGKTRQWSLRHFITSEEFMTEYLKYEFIPGRYLGCVSIQTN